METEFIEEKKTESVWTRGKKEGELGTGSRQERGQRVC